MEKTKGITLSNYDNSWYNPGPKLKIFFWFITNVLFFNNGFAIFNELKCWILRLYGAKVGRGVIIKPYVNIKYPWFLEIGDFVWIGEKVWVDNLTWVIINNNVCISQGALLLTGNHDYKSLTFDLLIGKIILEEGVWIGANSTVCPGVTCKTHSILTVGSVANKNLDSYSIYQGNPAIKIKSRDIKE